MAERLAEVKPSTAARELSTLRGLYATLIEAGLVAVDPTEGLSVSVGDSQRRLVLSEETVGRLLAESSRPPAARRSAEVCAALALRNRAAVELLYGLGLRAAEACGARLLDLDLSQRSLLARRVKGGPWQSLPLTAALVPHLERYVVKGRPALLAGQGGSCGGALLVGERGHALTPKHLQRLVARIAARAGAWAHPHALRRSVATHLVRRGASLPAVQRLLGHKSLDTTQRYVAVSADDLRAAVETLDRG
jgi:integrase/recombinase XerC